MNARTQISMDPELQQRAHAKAADDFAVYRYGRNRDRAFEVVR